MAGAKKEKGFWSTRRGYKKGPRRVLFRLPPPTFQQGVVVGGQSPTAQDEGVGRGGGAHSGKNKGRGAGRGESGGACFVLSTCFPSPSLGFHLCRCSF